MLEQRRHFSLRWSRLNCTFGPWIHSALMNGPVDIVVNGVAVPICAVCVCELALAESWADECASEISFDWSRNSAMSHPSLIGRNLPTTSKYTTLLFRKSDATCEVLCRQCSQSIKYHQNLMAILKSLSSTIHTAYYFCYVFFSTGPQNDYIFLMA